MEQKIIWTSYLLIGISIAVFSCKGRTEYGLTVEFQYDNNTGQNLEIFDIIENHKSTNVAIDNGVSKVFTIDAEGGFKNPTLDNCCHGILDSIHGGEIFIKISDTLCIVFENTGPHMLENYTQIILSERHFKYTYTFTENDFENALLCE